MTTEEHIKMPKLKIKGTSRLKLLRRTLRERPVLGKRVRELHIPDFQSLYHNATIDKNEIVNLVASVVMACPNLERIYGFHIPFTHTFDRLSHALSTRQNLKERLWILADNVEDEEEDLGQPYYHMAADPTERFLDLNSNHPRLTSFVLHQKSQRSSTQLSFRAIIGTLRQFPCLRHLSLSNMPSSSFSNLALNSLPISLKSLRLERLPGITDKGLQRFAKSLLTDSLQSLMLIDLEISSVTTIALFLSGYLSKLERLTLSQRRTPTLPFDAPFPTFQSPKLSYIHWEIRSQATSLLSISDSRSHQAGVIMTGSESISCLSTSLLSASIECGHFPSLRKIRAPHDPQGLLQSVCMPLATALLPSDKTLLTPSFSHHLLLDRSPASHSQVNLPRTFRPVLSHTMVKKAGIPPDVQRLSSPVQSRLAAQARLDASRKMPSMLIRVIDPRGRITSSKTVYGFMGSLNSRIEYEIRPDRTREWSHYGDEQGEEYEENDWIAGIGDVIGEWEEVASQRVDGRCVHHRSDGGGMKQLAGIMEMF